MSFWGDPTPRRMGVTRGHELTALAVALPSNRKELRLRRFGGGQVLKSDGPPARSAGDKVHIKTFDNDTCRYYRTRHVVDTSVWTDSRDDD